MTNLTFTKVGNLYESTFTITNTTAIHIERADNSTLVLSQNSGNSGQYVAVNEWSSHCNDSFIDTELVANVYPKYMKLTCKTKPAIAYIVEG